MKTMDLVGGAGVLKNIIAIASGAFEGPGYAENAKGLLISRGAAEMVYLAALHSNPFLAWLALRPGGYLQQPHQSQLHGRYRFSQR